MFALHGLTFDRAPAVATFGAFPISLYCLMLAAPVFVNRVRDVRIVRFADFAAHRYPLM